MTTFVYGVDYESLWNRLEARLLELQQGAAVSCCTEKDHDNLLRWQGIWGTFGTAYNEMQRLVDEARGKKPDAAVDNSS